MQLLLLLLKGAVVATGSWLELAASVLEVAHAYGQETEQRLLGRALVTPRRRSQPLPWPGSKGGSAGSGR